MPLSVIVLSMMSVGSVIRMIDYVYLRCFDRSGNVCGRSFDRGCFDLSHKMEDALIEFDACYGILYAIMADGSEEIICVVVR